MTPSSDQILVDQRSRVHLRVADMGRGRDEGRGDRNSVVVPGHVLRAVSGDHRRGDGDHRGGGGRHQRSRKGQGHTGRRGRCDGQGGETASDQREPL